MTSLSGPARSLLTHLACSQCDATYDADVPCNLCVTCGKPLLARYNLSEHPAIADWHRTLAARPWSMWRYTELLPLRRPEQRVSLGEQITPLLDLPITARRHGLRHLTVKDDGLLPTGSFKARGAAVGISRARELGIDHVILPTAGNAGGAWATYAARAGFKATVVMPQDAPEINVREVLVTGGDLHLVRGLISDAGAIVARAVARDRASGALPALFDAATLKEPYRIEGKKTMGFEIAEQYAWQLPDVIVYPCGGGVGLIGMWKAFDELEAIGAIGPRRPRMIAVQAEGCAPIVRAWEQGAASSTFWEDARTVASGIRVPKALGDTLVLRACRETGGSALAVADAEIVESVARVAADDGLFLSPEGAATVAALPYLRERGAIGADERIVLYNTGAGLKYPNVVQGEAPLIDPGDDL